MSDSAEPPKEIAGAIQCLGPIGGVQIDSPSVFTSEEGAWALNITIESQQTSDVIPAVSRWVVLIDPAYPHGAIRMYPAVDGGIVHTFPHQDRNVPSPKHPLWRLGKPCLDSPVQRLGRVAGGPEPKTDAELRLAWHVQRCIAWLAAAADHNVMAEGEPFETPQCPNEILSKAFRVVHDEGADCMERWTPHVEAAGSLHWTVLPGVEKTIIAERFMTRSGELIRVCRRASEPAEKPWLGFWWLWPKPIVLPPWHSPGTWGDIRRIGSSQGLDVDNVVQRLARQVRGEKAVILLLGYPIPSVWHRSAVEVHWQALLFPEIPAKVKPLNGFRNNGRGQWERLRRETFGNKKPLSYLATANWHPDRLQARGRLRKPLRDQHVVVIGVGALGSCVAELLARGGVGRLVLLDHDDLEVGNLVRHTLTASELKQNKATAVATRLQLAAPMANITGLPDSLPADPKQLQDLLKDADVVVDCTGEDVPLKLLEAAQWSIPKLFVSASVGFAARRVFIHTTRACSFPLQDFAAKIKPWLDRDRQEWDDAGETLEGPGCWSPLFPARYDDLFLAAAACVKVIDEQATSATTESRLTVFEQTFENDVFSGFRRCDAPEPQQ